jgi:hypothetical protein
MADTVPTGEEADLAAMQAVSSEEVGDQGDGHQPSLLSETEELVGDQGDGHQPSLLSETEDAISHLQVAEEASHESMEVVVGGEGNLTEQVSSQTLEPTEETASSSSSDSCKGSDKGDSAESSGSEESDAEEADHQMRDGRAQQRSGDGKGRRRRAPSRKRQPSLATVQRFFADPYTQEVLYRGKYFQNKPADCIKFCADSETGLPQHSYEIASRVGYGPLWDRPEWMGQGSRDTRTPDRVPEDRWGGVAAVVLKSGHTGFPKLWPEVKVPVSQLPSDRVTKEGLQALFTAYLECGMRCPVQGCEPWEALDHPKGALPQPQALRSRDVGLLHRDPADCSKFDSALACAPRTESLKEHGWKNLERVVEHWCHFHMKAGKCFSAPCCSKMPVETLGPRCQKAVFPSVTDAVEHLVEDHTAEVRQVQSDLQKEVDAHAKGKSRRQRRSGLSFDLKDLRSIAQKMLFEVMESYNQLVGIPRLLGRSRWFSNASLSRVVVGYHLSISKLDVTKQGWKPEHQRWVSACQLDYVKWTSHLPGYSGAPAKKTEGYRAAVTNTPTDSSQTRKGKAASGGPARKSGLTHPKQPTLMGPPTTVPPPRSGMLEMLANKFKISKHPAATSTVTKESSPEASTSSPTSTSPLSSLSVETSPAAQQEIGRSIAAAITAQTAPRGDKKRRKSKQSPVRDTSGTPTTSQKRDRSDSSSPAPNRGAKSQKTSTARLIDNLRESERVWQDRATRAEDALAVLKRQHLDLQKRAAADRTSYESGRSLLVADRDKEQARATKYKAECLAFRKERDDAVRERSELQCEVSRLTATGTQHQEKLATAERDVARLTAEVETMRKELTVLRKDATYAVPSGKLKVKHTPCQSEVMWTSEGSLGGRPTRSMHQMQRTFQAITTTLNDQRKEIIDAWQMMEEYAKADPDFDVFPAVYSCARQAMEQFTQVVRQELAPWVPSSTSNQETLADELGRLPLQSSATLEVVEMDTSGDSEVAVLRKELEGVRRELEVTREYASERKHDVTTMQKYEGRNADNVRELTVSLRAVSAGAIRLLEQLDVEQRPQLARESRALKHALQEMSDAAATVEPRSHAIGQEQRVRRVLPSLPPTSATGQVTAAATTAIAATTVISATVTSSVTGPAFTQVQQREPSLGLTTAAEESLDEEAENRLLAQTPPRPKTRKSSTAATSGSDHSRSPRRSPRRRGPPPKGGNATD